MREGEVVGLMALASGIVEALCDIVGGEHVWLGPNRMIVDSTGTWRRVDADAVVFPHATREVAELVRGAAVSGIPITFLSAWNQSPTPWLNPGGVVLVLTRMDRILEISTVRRLVRAQPGVATARLAASAAAAGPLNVPGRCCVLCLNCSKCSG